MRKAGFYDNSRSVGQGWLMWSLCRKWQWPFFEFVLAMNDPRSKDSIALLLLAVVVVAVAALIVGKFL